MMFLALPGVTQTVIVVLLVLLLFGARRLPDLAKALGSSISQFKKGLKEPEDDPLAQDEAQRRLEAGSKPPLPSAARPDAARLSERDRA